jgi:hypothetical protein
MFLKLTNQHPTCKGEPLILNSTAIVSIRQGMAKREGDVMEPVTFVFCPPHGSWEVKESLDEIYKLLKKSLSVK